MSPPNQDKPLPPLHLRTTHYHHPWTKPPPPPLDQAPTIAASACTPSSTTLCPTSKSLPSLLFNSLHQVFELASAKSCRLALPSLETSRTLNTGKRLVQLLPKQVMVSPLSSLARSKITLGPNTGECYPGRIRHVINRVVLPWFINYIATVI